MGQATCCSAPVRWPVVIGIFTLLIAVFYLDYCLGLHDRVLTWMIASIAFFHTKTFFACGCYVAAYVAASLLCVPLTPFEILTGFIFGVPFGIVLDIAGRLTGAILSFQIARFLLRRNTECSVVQGNKVMKGIGAAVEEQGLRFLVLFNLAYVPVAVKNYGLGFIPEVSLGKFVAAIFIVEVPMATVWAFVGSGAAQGLEAEGLSLTSPGEVRGALAGTRGGSHSHVKLGVLIVGVLSILAVLHLIHKKVSSELGLHRESGSEHALTPTVEQVGHTWEDDVESGRS